LASTLTRFMPSCKSLIATIQFPSFKLLTIDSFQLQR
jgi:hypothetical protein